MRRIPQLGNRRYREFNRLTICLFNGKPLLRAQWSKVTVGPGDVCTFVTQLQGGGNAGKQIAGIVVAIAIAVAAPYLAPIIGGALFGASAVAAGGFLAAGTLGGALLTAGIGIALTAGAAGLMSLFAGAAPPPANYASSPSMSAVAGSAQASPTFSIGAQGNSARLEQAQPELTGRHVVFPDFEMLPYSRYVDNEQYLHSLLVPSRGSIEIEKWRIGDTPIESFEEITTEQREPGEVGDPEICDARWLPCRDIATVVLPDAGDDPPSPWKGPFAANPPGTIVDQFEVDLITPGGLYKYNASGGFDTKSITVVIEAQEIDGAGVAVGDPDTWEEIDTITKSAATQKEQRSSETYDFSSPGRWQVRLKRTDTKDTSATARHDIQWVGLRGRLTTERRFAGVTTLAVRMKATGDLNSATSRQVNIIATRKLPTWDFETETMTEELVATRCPCDVFAHIARTWLPDDKIDLAGIYAKKAEFAAAGWTFDFVWDQPMPTREALQRVARAVVGVEVEQGQKVCLVLDRASTAPTMMFTPRNIRKGTFKLDIKMV
ncbi:MAG: host specificity factor TipJ family phage tail protein, partial [Acidobacteriota bacterium]